MVSKTYTARELLRVRNVSAGKELYDRLFDKLRKDAGLGEIFRLPSDSALPLIKEEDSDVPGNSDCVPAKSAAARQLDGTDAEWKYRGRTDSEEDVAHPICGPAGLVAQKDEGFQRFYKAVVSSTHVRVTAGGRIVPNTRGSSSPTAKWAKDKVSADGVFSSRVTSRDQPEHGPFPIPQAPFGLFPPMIPGLAPGMSPGMPTGHPPFPMMPWHMGVNMGGTFGMVHPHMAQMPGPFPSAKSSTASLKSDKHSEAGNSENSNSVRISPPEQFDHSRPFFYNGQWMMPPGATVYPFGMPPVAGFPMPMAGQAMLHPRFGMHPMMHLHAMKSDPSIQSHASSASNAPAFVGASNPLVSSIHQSEITKRQLENLRSHLKYLEDQLQYNKHQIDEKSVEQQTQVLCHQIQLFEKNLQAQVSHEESQFPKSDKIEESNSSTSSRDGLRSKSSITSDPKPGHDSNSVSTSQDETPHARTVKGQKGKDRESSQLPSGSGSSKSMPLKSALKKPRPSEPAKKPSTLPVSAALAPPFQPQTDGTASASATTDSSLGSAVPSISGEPPCQMVDSENKARKPYLIGTLPRGCNPAVARDTDYMYGRDLTEDELRARHMYWGNAPRNLQKGFPKFDGKDFYPPSPVRGSSSESGATSSSSMQRRRIPSGNNQSDYGLASVKTENDPFALVARPGQRLARCNLPQSEHLPRLEPSVTPALAAAKQSPRKATFQNGRSYDDFRKALGENGQPSGCCKDKSSSESGDDSNILFKGRRHVPTNKSKNPNEIWQSMLKRGKSSSTAVPGTVSSMTARGVLPNYAGHATASLTPTIANTSVAPKSSARKPGNSGDAGSANPDEERNMNNRPPTGTNLRGSLRRADC